MWQQIESNKRKSILLVFFMAGLLFLLGYALGEYYMPHGGLIGLFIAFIVWIIMTITSYFSGDSIFLSMSNAHKITAGDHQVLFDVVEEMKIASGLPKMPDIYIIDDDAPNAFAVGRSPETASVAVTSGLLSMLNRDELQGVIAHEMAHISNRDTLYMLFAGIMMGCIILLADIGARSFFYSGSRRSSSSSNSSGGSAQVIFMIIALVLIIIAPIVAQLIYYALSRRREYLADACSAQFTRYPTGLASALEKISGIGLKLKNANRATAPMYIVNPLKIKVNKLDDLSSTHPPTSKRIAILRKMAGADWKSYNEAYQEATNTRSSIISGQGLVRSSAIPIREASESDSSTVIDRTRETTDLLWKINDYIFIGCDCGTSLKIPPVYTGKTIPCPHCNKEHSVGQQNNLTSSIA